MKLDLSAYIRTSEDLECWNIVKAHYGKDYSNSGVLIDLVRKKAGDITGKVTNRQMTQRLIDAIERLETRVGKIEECLGVEVIAKARATGCDCVAGFDDDGMEIEQ